MSWTVHQIAQQSGVTTRTLRYYDEIGLLPPARIGTNGYRIYEREQLFRLQQILLYRELGLDLRGIAAVIDDEHDPVEALSNHHTRLVAERDRLDRLTSTVSNTLTHLRKGAEMPMADMFRAMTPERTEYLAGLPKKRTAAGVLLRDDNDRVLLMKPTYKPYWQLPGCVVDQNESPLAATIRSTRERLGLTIAPSRLLVSDWVAPTPSRIEGLLFVFDGGDPLTSEQVAQIVLSSAFETWAFSEDDELAERLPQHMLDRTRAAVRAREAGTTLYMENGISVRAGDSPHN